MYTSELDAYNTALNSRAQFLNAEVEKVVLTPLEQTLCSVTTDIYDTTLKALNYLKGDISDEAAITLMALIANFKVNEAFGYEPAGPILETVVLDTVVRTAFIDDVLTIGDNTNTLYAMVQQGDSIGHVLLVVMLELVITLASMVRIACIIYISVASFVILALRLIHRTPSINKLVYGIVGNVFALLFTHALTLFLIIVAIEWVASAADAIPDLLLDILVIAFIILMLVLLFKLIRNIVKDAYNMGGTKFQESVYNVGDALMNMMRSVTNSQNVQSNADTITIGAQTAINNAINEAEHEDLRRRGHTNRTRVEAVVTELNRIDAESENDSGTSNIRLQNNINAEQELSSADA